MAFDINNQYTGKLYGQDRVGHTTPDLEANDDVRRPWLPVPYPAPYLPALRQDQGHPKLASVVLSSQHLVAQDKSGALVPAGLICGKTPAGSNKWCILQYNGGSADGFTVDPRTGSNVTPGDHVVLAAPADAAPGNVTLSNGSVVSVTVQDIAWAWACNLFPNTTSGSVSGQSETKYTLTVASATDTLGGKLTFEGVDLILGTASTTDTIAHLATTINAGNYGVVATVATNVLTLTPNNFETVTGTLVTDNGSAITLASVANTGQTSAYSYGVARPIGVATRNVFQYIGGVVNLGTSGGLLYRLEGMVPTGFQIMNYMHEMGTAIQTQYVLRLPWIGAAPNTLQTLAGTDGISGYVQSYGRSFAHFTGSPTTGAGVTFSTASGDQGNYGVFDATSNSPVDLIGRVIGVVNMINKVGFSNRVKTLWDPSRMTGPMADPNPASIMMGGSATAGMPYDINLTTDGIYKAAVLQNKTKHAEYGTYVLVRVNL